MSLQASAAGDGGHGADVERESGGERRSIGGASKLPTYAISHVLVAHREEREFSPGARTPMQAELERVAGYSSLPDKYKAVLANELQLENETLLWVEKPTFFSYTKSQWIAILCISAPLWILGGVTAGLGQPVFLVGVLVFWLVILGMFGLRWWCNVFETPLTCYALTNQRALVLRFPHGRREVISVTYFEMRTKTGVSKIETYNHWDSTHTVYFGSLPEFGRVGFQRFRDLDGVKTILDREATGPRPRTAPLILKKAFIAQLLKENENPKASEGLTRAQADFRRMQRATAIMAEQDRRRALGLAGTGVPGSPRPIAGVSNALVRRESAMSAFSGLTDNGDGAGAGGDAPVGRNKGKARMGSSLGPSRTKAADASDVSLSLEQSESEASDDRRRRKGKGKRDMPELRGSSEEESETRSAFSGTDDEDAYEEEDDGTFTESGGGAPSGDSSWDD